MNKRKEKVYAVACIILMLDQFIKIIIKTKMTVNQEITIIPKFFSLLYLKNTGAAFSLLSNMTPVLIMISVLFIYLLNRYIERDKTLTKRQLIYIGLILGGIFGNLLDRIIYKAVIDYLAFTILNYNFPVFNMADIAITVSTVLLIINIIRNKKGDKNDSKRSV